MTSITLVAESKLYPKDNTPLYEYFDDYSKLFNFLVRRCIHHLKKKTKWRTGILVSNQFNVGVQYHKSDGESRYQNG